MLKIAYFKTRRKINRYFCNKIQKMFKKVAHILIVSLLLISTSGISMTRHFCGNTLESFSIYGTPHRCCDSSCDKCHNKHTFKKVTDEFTGSGVSIVDFKADSHSINAIVIFNISDHLVARDVRAYIDLRKFLTIKAGDSPALICNFRC